MAVAKNNSVAVNQTLVSSSTASSTRSGTTSSGFSPRLLVWCVGLGVASGLAFFVIQSVFFGWDQPLQEFYLTACLSGGLLFGILHYLLFSKLYLAKLRNIIDVIDAVGAGDLSAHCKHTSDINDVVDRIGYSLNRMSTNLRSNITSIAESTYKVSNAVSKLSSQDGLIGGNTAFDRRKNSRRPVAQTNNSSLMTTTRSARTTPPSAGKPASRRPAATKTPRQPLNAPNGEKPLAKKSFVDSERNQKTNSTEPSLEKAPQSAKTAKQLEQESQEIAKVLDVIQSIALQTYLLALNAAMDAAKAGEQGRGFAVVADEVGALALRTQKSTLEIKHMIDQLQSGGSDMAKVMDAAVDKAKKRMDETRSERKSPTAENKAGHIQDNRSQSQSPAKRDGAVTQSSSMVERRATLPKKATQSHLEITRLVEELRKAISLFKR